MNEYKYPTHLSDEELSLVLRKVLDNLYTLQKLHTEHYLKADIAACLQVRRAIDLHNLTLVNFLKNHPMEEVQ